MHALGLKVIMITGDNAATAHAIRTKVGIDRVLAEVLPADKAAAVKALQPKGRSWRWSAMESTTHQRSLRPMSDCQSAPAQTSDRSRRLTLMSGDLRVYPARSVLSRSTMRTIRENLLWAFGYNIALIPVRWACWQMRVGRPTSYGS